MFFIDLSTVLDTVDKLIETDSIPINLDQNHIAGTIQSPDHKFAIDILTIKDGFYRICLLSGNFVLVMFQDTEDEYIHYVKKHTLTSYKVPIDSTEELLFQNSLLDTTLCTYQDLETMKKMVNRAKSAIEEQLTNEGK